LIPGQTIEYLGRIDEQAKIRGQRLELAEVSECLRSSSLEPLSVATMVTQHPSLKRDLLVSFIAPAGRRGSTITSEPAIQLSESDLCQSLQAACRERLPVYMVPDMVLAIDFLPLAAISGKADLKMLRRIFSETPLEDLLGRKDQAKRDLTPYETKVRDIIRGLLKDTDAEINHNTTTLELGVDSLAAISLSIRLIATGFDAPVPYLIRGPTIESIAKRSVVGQPSSEESTIQGAVHRHLQEMNANARASLVSYAPESVVHVLPTLPLQESLIARSLDSSSPLYINHVILQLRPGIKETLIGAVNATVSQNEILRTSFATIGSQIVQVILKDGSYPSPWTRETIVRNVDVLPLAREALGGIAEDISGRLLSIPPLRLSLYTNSTESIMVLSMHHSIYDGRTHFCSIRELFKD
jgi:ferricrocin synthase